MCERTRADDTRRYVDAVLLAQATKQSSINSSIMVLHVAGCFNKVQSVPFLTQPIDDKQLNATT
jgi:hypothetical protein